jgi:Aminoglycoside adenylyltransferase, C-terminal domain
VTWHTLARHGVAVRGPEPARHEIHTDPVELRDWTRANLDGYWRDWVLRARRLRTVDAWALPDRFAAWGVLGVSRLPYTLATGEISNKEAAGEYALEAFGPRWRPVIEDALEYWRGAPQASRVLGGARRPGQALRRSRAAADFVAHVIESAPELKDFTRGPGAADP